MDLAIADLVMNLSVLQNTAAYSGAEVQVDWHTMFDECS